MATDPRSPSDSAEAIARAAPGQRSRRAGARQVLEQCWTPLWKAVEPTLVSVIVEAMTPAAKSADHGETAAMKFVRARDREFVLGYKEELHSEFEAALRDFIAGKSSDTPPPSAGLSLVEYDEMEQLTLVVRGSVRIRNATDALYSSVKGRLARLVGEPEIAESENPFRPAVFYRAASGALKRIGTAPGDLLPMLDLLCGPLAKAVAAAYRALDETLKSEGLSAELAPGAWRGNRPRADQRAPMREAEAATAAPGGPSGDADLLRTLFDKIESLAAAMPGPAAGADRTLGTPPVSDSSAAAPIAGAAPAGPTAAPIEAAAEGAQPAGGLDEPQGVTADRSLEAAIDAIQAQCALQLSSSSWDAGAPDTGIDAVGLRGRLMAQASRPEEEMKIDLVGRLFDRIGQDPDAPPGIGVLLQLLQFPMIKAALRDWDMFTGACQADARRLIDSLASVAWEGRRGGVDDRRRFGEARKAVRTVLAAPSEDVAAWERAAVDFETFLREDRARDDGSIARAKPALTAAEAAEVMAIKAAIKLRGALEGVPVDSYITDFLLGAWAHVLGAASSADGSARHRVQRYAGMVPDLVWSVQAKRDADERRRLVAVIPAVLTALREGLASIDWDDRETRAFVARLMSSHAQAVKPTADQAPRADTPRIDVGAMRSRIDPFRLDAVEVPASVLAGIRVHGKSVRRALAAAQTAIEYIEADSSSDTGEAVVSEADLEQVLARLRRGDWLGLRRGGATERVRLRWVSPHKALYIFMPADGGPALCLGPDSLSTFLRRGDLRLLVPAPLFDRAAQAVMRDLQHATTSTTA